MVENKIHCHILELESEPLFHGFCKTIHPSALMGWKINKYLDKEIK